MLPLPVWAMPLPALRVGWPYGSLCHAALHSGLAVPCVREGDRQTQYRQHRATHACSMAACVYAVCVLYNGHVFTPTVSHFHVSRIACLSGPLSLPPNLQAEAVILTARITDLT